MTGRYEVGREAGGPHRSAEEWVPFPFFFFFFFCQDMYRVASSQLSLYILPQIFTLSDLFPDSFQIQRGCSRSLLPSLGAWKWWLRHRRCRRWSQARLLIGPSRYQRARSIFTSTRRTGYRGLCQTDTGHLASCDACFIASPSIRIPVSLLLFHSCHQAMYSCQCRQNVPHTGFSLVGRGLEVSGAPPLQYEPPACTSLASAAAVHGPAVRHWPQARACQSHSCPYFNNCLLVKGFIPLNPAYDAVEPCPLPWWT